MSVKNFRPQVFPFLVQNLARHPRTPSISH